MSYEVKRVNKSTTDRRISDLLKSIEKTSNNLLIDVAEDTVKEAKENLRLNGNIDTGELVESIDVLEVGNDFVIVGSPLMRAQYIEFGRGPVFAKDKPLHWVDKKTGEDVFAMSASPVDPQPFMQPAVEAVTSRYENIVAEKYND